jgi:hypothetical protein
MILSPDDRTLWLDALRPPEGYTFDRGVGTTFTLNLSTLLVAPLSLALHDVASTEEALSDPIMLLDGIRRHAKRIMLFCQSGYIAIPKQANHLYRFLEDMVVEVKAPNGGLFHPKVWLLRYTSDHGPDIVRFLCASRNMDFSRSWDVLLRLDGEVQDRQLGYSQNSPLTEFFSTLPDFATRKIPAALKKKIRKLSEDARKVDFQVPSPFFEDYLEFIPLGHRTHRPLRLKDTHWRSMVVSPFLSESILQDVTSSGEEHILFSEAESLRMIEADTLNRFEKIFIFNDVAMCPPEDGKNEEVGEGTVSVEQISDPSRLHAKLFILENGWDAYWLIGSANATYPAWDGRNVEFMVGLTGRKSRVGIDCFIGEEGDKFSLRALLVPYRIDEQIVEDAEGKALEEALDQIRTALLVADLHIEITEDKKEGYNVQLKPTRKRRITNTRDAKILTWPITLQESRAVNILEDEKLNIVAFDNVSLLGLTTFIAFHVEISKGGRTRSIRFVLHLPVEGMPGHRDDVLLSAILSDQAQFLRYLRYLLAQELGWIPTLEQESSHESPSTWEWKQVEVEDVALLEDIARAFSRSPEKIDQVSDLVARLRSTEQGRSVLPEGFEHLWEELQQARKRER